MRVALYARVSTTRQEQERTIASQVEALEAYANQMGYEIVPDGRFSDDGFSGARLDRPALDALRDAARVQAFDAVLVHNPDRLARKYAYQVVILEEFQRAGIDVVFLEQPPLDDPAARLLVQIQGAVAEYERTKIAERNRRGRLYRLRQGEVSIAAAPYGYRRIARTPTSPAHLEVDEPGAAVVRQIFLWHAHDGWSLRKIAWELTTRGIPTPKGGTLWSSSEIRTIVHNDVYSGNWTVNRRRTTDASNSELRPVEEWITLAVPAIIDQETFQHSQQRHTKNQRFSPRNLKNEQRWLLRGMVRCGLCGHSVVTLRTPKGRGQQGVNEYYRCRHTHKEETLTPCRGPYMRALELDCLVWNEVCQLLTHPALLRQSIMDGAIVSDNSAMVHVQLTAVQRQLSAAMREKARLMDAYQASLIELSDLQSRLRSLGLRITQWEQEAHRLSQLQQEAAAEEELLRRLDTLATKVESRLSQLDFAGRQALVREVLDHVVASPGEVRLHFAIPLPPDDGTSPSDAEVSSKLHLRACGGRTLPFPEKPISCRPHLPAEAESSEGFRIPHAPVALDVQHVRVHHSSADGAREETTDPAWKTRESASDRHGSP